MAKGLITTPILLMLAIVIASAQGDVNAVRNRVQQRFQVLPLADGVVLTPRFKTAVRSIEVSDTIAVDGSPVSSGELREKLGADADIVLQVSYLDATSRKALAGMQEVPSIKPADPTAPTLDSPVATTPQTPRLRRRDDVVRIGGSVTIDADETVEGDVVVIGGSATVNGEVDGELVVVGGSAKLGPQAEVRRDVTVVGGSLSRDPTAVIRGKVQEVGFGDVPWEGGWPWNREGRWSRRAARGWNPMDGFYPLARFMGTLVRVGLLVLLAALVMFVARTPVEQIADRAAAEPIKSWAVGFLAQILFVPILVLTTVVLAISIIGIPLLLLIPVAIVAAMVVFLVGFTGVAYHVGRLLQGRVEQLRTRPYAATFLGIAVILSPLLLARVVGLIGGLGVIVWALVSIGIVLEYIAWTTGLGAAALARFDKPLPSPASGSADLQVGPQ